MNSFFCNAAMATAMLMIGTVTSVNAANIAVSSAAQLQSALSAAKGGDVISLAPGQYGSVKVANKNYLAPVSVVSATLHGAQFTYFEIGNSSNITLSGLRVNVSKSAYYGMRLISADKIQIDNCYLYGADFMAGKTLMLDRVSNIVIKNNFITHTNDGIHSVGKMLNVLIEANHIEARPQAINASAHPDNMQLRSGPLQNLRIVRNILLNSSQNIFQQNQGVAPWENVVIAGNFSHLSDRGGSYGGKHIFMGAINNLTIEGNTMVTSDPISPSVYGHGVMARGTGSYIVRNNIFYNSVYASPAPVSTNNIFFKTTSRYLIGTSNTLQAYVAANPGREAGSMQKDPMFRDLPHDDYTLSASSPAIDAGVALTSITAIDLTGKVRPSGSGWDIGAYEY